MSLVEKIIRITEAMLHSCEVIDLAGDGTVNTASVRNWIFELWTVAEMSKPEGERKPVERITGRDVAAETANLKALWYERSES